MPVTKSAIKAMHQSRKANERNKATKADFRVKVKATKKAAASQDKDFAKTLSTAIQALDKAAKKGVLHKNTAARRKSRLMSALNKVLGKVVEPASIKAAPKAKPAAKTTTKPAAKKTPSKKSAK